MNTMRALITLGATFFDIDYLINAGLNPSLDDLVIVGVVSIVSITIIIGGQNGTFRRCFQRF